MDLHAWRAVSAPRRRCHVVQVTQDMQCNALRCDAMQVGVKAAIRIEDEVKS